MRPSETDAQQARKKPPAVGRLFSCSLKRKGKDMDMAVDRKLAWHIIFQQDQETFPRSATRICPLMRKIAYKKAETDTCDCSRLRAIAIKLLDPRTRCKSGRPCPVREYLLK